MESNVDQIADIMKSKGKSRELFGVQMVVCGDNHDWVPVS